MDFLRPYLGDIISSARGLVAERCVLLSTQFAGGKLHSCYTAVSVQQVLLQVAAGRAGSPFPILLNKIPLHERKSIKEKAF